MLHLLGTFLQQKNAGFIFLLNIESIIRCNLVNVKSSHEKRAISLQTELYLTSVANRCPTEWQIVFTSHWYGIPDGIPLLLKWAPFTQTTAGETGVGALSIWINLLSIYNPTGHISNIQILESIARVPMVRQITQVIVKQQIHIFIGYKSHIEPLDYDSNNFFLWKNILANIFRNIILHLHYMNSILGFNYYKRRKKYMRCIICIQA